MTSTRIKLRSACDICHRLKVRCSSTHPCSGCVSSGSLCSYSPASRLGRPKGTGTKNQRSTEKWLNNSASQRNGDTRKSGNIIDDGEKVKSSSQQLLDLPSEICIPQPRQSVISSKQSTNQPPASSVVTTCETTSNELMDTIMMDNGVFHPSDFHIPASWDLRSFERQVGLHKYQGEFNGSLSNNFNPQNDLFDNLPSLSIINVQHTSRTPIPQRSNQNQAESSTSKVINQNSPEDNGNYPPTPPTPLLSTKMKPSTCTCFRQLLELLYDLKVLESSIYNSRNTNEPAIPIDTTLQRVQESLKCWRGLIECENCTYNDDQEVIILTFMSIRSLITYLQRLIPQYGRELPWNDSQTQRLLFGQPQLEEQRLSIGSFDITGDDRKLAIRLLLLNKVREITSTLLGLESVLDRMKKRVLEEAVTGSAGRTTSNRDVDRLLTEQSRASGSLLYAQQILEELINSTKELNAALRLTDQKII